jgi:hypothetical protein
MVHNIQGGGRIDLYAHDASRVALATYPATEVGVYDLCNGCREALKVWITERKKVSKKEV